MVWVSLARTRGTVAAYYLPPAGVATPRRFNCSAAFRADNSASSENTGRSCSARSRAACCSAMPFAFRSPHARRSIAMICTGVHVPPRAVGTPRALSAAAIARNDVIPDFLICSITGRVLAANWSAFSRFA
jgi:hypothetical protein